MPQDQLHGLSSWLCVQSRHVVLAHGVQVRRQSVTLDVRFCMPYVARYAVHTEVHTVH